jgi:hypothetical protein
LGKGTGDRMSGLKWGCGVLQRIGVIGTAELALGRDVDVAKLTGRLKDGSFVAAASGPVSVGRCV